MGSTRRLITVRLPEDLLVEVESYVKAEGLTRTGLIQELLEGIIESERVPVRAAEPPAAPKRSPVPAVPGVVRASEVAAPVVRERPKPMSDAELRAWKRSQTGRGAPGVA